MFPYKRQLHRGIHTAHLKPVQQTNNENGTENYRERLSLHDVPHSRKSLMQAEIGAIYVHEANTGKQVIQLYAQPIKANVKVNVFRSTTLSYITAIRRHSEQNQRTLHFVSTKTLTNEWTEEVRLPVPPRAVGLNKMIL